MLDAMTQGRTRKEALEMVEDMVETLANRADFRAHAYARANGEIEVGSDDARTMVSLILQRQRQRSGLTATQAAERLGAKSRDAYARYERGQHVPTLEKLDELLNAVAPGRELVLLETTTG